LTFYKFNNKVELKFFLNENKNNVLLYPYLYIIITYLHTLEN